MELPTVALVLFVLAGLGVFMSILQLAALLLHRRKPRRRPTHFPGISILKPLCGLDDALVENIERFAHLDYPEYELVLGVKDVNDAAWSVAHAAEKRWPARVRVIVQHGAGGLNPKVNQLTTLSESARYEVFVVSDSNVRVDRDYLLEIAAHFEDDDVGLVSHAIRGLGERSFGATLDNLHLTTSIAPGVIGAKVFAGQDIVVGKSMALRRADIAAIGGFAAFKDILAEDYFIGRAVRNQLGKRIVIARAMVTCYARHKSVAQFFARYRRWSVIHRQSVALPVYLGELLLNPLSIALAAALLSPGDLSLASTLVLLNLACSITSARVLRSMPIDLQTVAALMLKDVLMSICWVHGLLERSVDWRGNRLVVLPGTRLAQPEQAPRASEPLTAEAQ